MIIVEYKAVYLVVLCCFLIHVTVIGTDLSFYHMHSAFGRDRAIVSLTNQTAAYLLSPVLGWLANVWFKFILLGVILMKVGTIVALCTAAIELLLFSILLLLLLMIGFHLKDTGSSVAYELMKTQCPSYWVTIALVDPFS